MRTLISVYGSVEATLERLNELKSQLKLADEAGVSPSSVSVFLQVHGVKRVTRWARAVDKVQVEIAQKGA